MTYFITGNLYLVINLIHFVLPWLPTSGNHQSVLCVYEWGFFEISHKSEIFTVFVLFSDFYHLA